MNKLDNLCSNETWRTFWAKKLDLSQQLEYHFSSRQLFYELLNRSIASLDSTNGLNILEIGCGTAIDSCILANIYKGLRIFCLDIFYPAVKQAREIAWKFNVSLQFLNCDANRIGFKDGSFDLIFSQGVIEHFFDISSVMEEQVRLLKDGGILIIDVPQAYTLCSIFKHRMMKKGKWPVNWETQYSYRDLVSLGRKYGLKVIDVCGHEHDSHVRFFNLLLLRNIIKRFQKGNPLRELIFFKKLDSVYDSIWNVLERKWGHYFLVNIAVVYKK